MSHLHNTLVHPWVSRSPPIKPILPVFPKKPTNGNPRVSLLPWSPRFLHILSHSIFSLPLPAFLTSSGVPFSSVSKTCSFLAVGVPPLLPSSPSLFLYSSFSPSPHFLLTPPHHITQHTSK